MEWPAEGEALSLYAWPWALAVDLQYEGGFIRTRAGGAGVRVATSHAHVRSSGVDSVLCDYVGRGALESLPAVGGL